jgi:hypothetical protein
MVMPLFGSNQPIFSLSDLTQRIIKLTHMRFSKQAFVFMVVLTQISTPVHAVRTAVFTPEVRGRAAIWLDQDRILKAERGSDAQRSIWIHGGDSLSTAWSNGPSLRNKLLKAEQGPIAEPRSMQDFLSSLPDATRTWYAGSSYGYGILGRLESMFHQPWVILSTALAGAKITAFPRGDMRESEDPLQFLLDIKANPERVKLITFSLGNNDLCDGDDPGALPGLPSKLDAIRTRYSKASVVPFAVIPVEHMYERIMNSLNALPPSPGKNRIIAYCQKTWESVCPAAIQSLGILRVQNRRANLHEEYRRAFGDDSVFDILAPVADLDPLDMLSGDCFHPSGDTAAKIIDPFARHIQTILK